MAISYTFILLFRKGSAFLAGLLAVYITNCYVNYPSKIHLGIAPLTLYSGGLKISPKEAGLAIFARLTQAFFCCFGLWGPQFPQSRKANLLCGGWVSSEGWPR